MRSRLLSRSRRKSSSRGVRPSSNSGVVGAAAASDVRALVRMYVTALEDPLSDKALEAAQRLFIATDYVCGPMKSSEVCGQSRRNSSSVSLQRADKALNLEVRSASSSFSNAAWSDDDDLLSRRENEPPQQRVKQRVRPRVLYASVVGAHVCEKPAPKHVQYVVRVRATDEFGTVVDVTVTRRYLSFLSLHRSLVASTLDAEESLPKLPSKKWFVSRFDQTHVSDRQAKLHLYLQSLLRYTTANGEALASSASVLAFLTHRRKGPKDVPDRPITPRGLHLRLILEPSSSSSSCGEACIAEQDFRCAQCACDTFVTTDAKLCLYSHKYFCGACFFGPRAVNDDYDDPKPFKRTLPYKVLQEWDFSQVEVSHPAAMFLDDLYRHPLYRVESCASKLVFDTVEVFPHCEILRLQLKQAKLLVERNDCKECATFMREDVERALLGGPFRAHLLNNTDFYSMEDLTELHQGTLNSNLAEAVESLARRLAVRCDSCSKTGRACSLCKCGPALFPFEINEVARCAKCDDLFHRACYERDDEFNHCCSLTPRVSDA